MNLITWGSTQADNVALLPHGYCIAWEPSLVAEMIVGNAMIALAYIIIPVQLIRLLMMHNGRGLFISRIATTRLIFAAFIVSCGVGHVIDILVLFAPIYWLQAHWTVATGIISLAAAAITELSLEPAET